MSRAASDLASRVAPAPPTSGAILEAVGCQRMAKQSNIASLPPIEEIDMHHAQLFFKAGLGLLLLVSSMAGRAGADGTSPARSPEHLGTVAFAVSCSPATQADFNRGVALLHDFWYEESKPQFQRILKSDPGCAMAHWGIAMSGFHQIWDRPDPATIASGWREMQAAQGHPARTARGA